MGGTRKRFHFYVSELYLGHAGRLAALYAELFTHALS
jgi:hypothetical protein